jgi:S-formylglutathione hydrolase FrmB
MRHVVVTLAAIGAVLSGTGCLSRTFEVTFDGDVRDAPASGRLVVYLAPAGEGEPGYSIRRQFPMFGVDVVDAAPGETMMVSKGATPFVVPAKNLEAGTYRAMGVLDLARQSTSWRREPGNLYSDVVEIELSHRSAAYPIRLTHVVEARAFPESERVREVSVHSERLSSFRREEVVLRAGVVMPRGYDAGRAYPALYVVPGFGGDHFGALGWARRLEGAEPGSDLARLGESAFVIVLDPDGPNGHTLFADSANNGPAGEALVSELIPEIERRFNLISEPSARMLRGHSSGGWSVVWLALTYPDTFGAAWSLAPDPVDFRAFQDINIYEDAAAYLREQIEYDWLTQELQFYDREWVPSMRDDGEVVVTVRNENRMEEVLGPDNASGQQWDSWFAVFGPRNERGHPAALWDHPSGRINRAIARRYVDHDIGLVVEGDPDKARLLRERVRLICGDEDNYYLNQGVALLAERLASVPRRAGDAGYVRIVAGADHGSIADTPEARAFDTEMIEHMRAHGHLEDDR